jgi:hypothetical protein
MTSDQSTLYRPQAVYPVLSKKLELSVDPKPIQINFKPSITTQPITNQSQNQRIFKQNRRRAHCLMRVMWMGLLIFSIGGWFITLHYFRQQPREWHAKH